MYQFEAHDADQKSRITYAIRSSSPIAGAGAAGAGEQLSAASSHQMFQLEPLSGILSVAPRAQLLPSRQYLLRGVLRAAHINTYDALYKLIINSKVKNKKSL